MISRGNKNRLKSTALTDEAGQAITTGTVRAAVLSRDRTTEYFENEAATHLDGGVWHRDISAADIETNIPTAVARAWVRFQVVDGADLVAEMWRLESVGYRESSA